MTQMGDRLENTLKRASNEKLHTLLNQKEPKGKMLTIRISPSELEAIKATAASFGLTVTEYLLRLHRFASQQVAETEECNFRATTGEKERGLT